MDRAPTYRTREEALAANGGRTPQQARAYASSKAMNGQVAGTMHNARLRVANLLTRELTAELDALEQNPNQQERLQMLVVLDMMLSPRTSSATKGREAYLRLKGLLPSEEQAQAARQEQARQTIDGLM